MKNFVCYRELVPFANSRRRFRSSRRLDWETTISQFTNSAARSTKGASCEAARIELAPIQNARAALRNARNSHYAERETGKARYEAGSSLILRIPRDLPLAGLSVENSTYIRRTTACDLHARRRYVMRSFIARTKYAAPRPSATGSHFVVTRPSLSRNSPEANGKEKLDSSK